MDLTGETHARLVLKIDAGAIFSSAELRTAYRQQALESHPDKVAAGDREAAAVRFREVRC